jgi:hypothetical protein
MKEGKEKKNILLRCIQYPHYLGSLHFDRIETVQGHKSYINHA